MDVEPVGNMDMILLSLETEVKELVDNLSPELLVKLLDKWESDIVNDRIEGGELMVKRLRIYVNMKIMLQRMKRKLYDCYLSPCAVNGQSLEDQIVTFTSKVKDARREYYVAKRRAEGEHRNDCTCRGCRCLGQDGRGGA